EAAAGLPPRRRDETSGDGAARGRRYSRGAMRERLTRSAFLRRGAAVAAVTLGLPGCSGSPPASSSAPPTSTTPTPPPSAGAPTLADLRASLSGGLLMPGQPGYAAAR